MEKFTKISLKTIGIPKYSPFASRFVRLILWIVNVIFLIIKKNVFIPSPADHKRKTTQLLFVILISVCILLLIVTLPPCINFIIEKCISNEFKEILIKHKISLKSWLSWFSLLLEIISVFLLGGAVFGEWSTKSFQESLNNFQKNEINKIEEDRSRLMCKVNKKIQKIKEVLECIKNELSYKKKFRSMVEILKQAYNFFDNIPEYQGRYLFLIFYTRFPGGLYGLSVFLAFIILSFIKVGLLYLDNNLLH